MIKTPGKQPSKEVANSSHTLKAAILSKIKSNKHLKSCHHQSVYKYEQENIEEELEELKLLQAIKQYESKDHKGYITFEKWQEIHEVLWGKTVLNSSLLLWKILRLINRGEVKIPTGLVYEVLKAITIKRNQGQVKQAINSFLAQNKIRGGLSTFRELKNSPSFEAIVKMYRDNDTQRKRTEKRRTQFPIRLANSNKQKERAILKLRFQSMANQMNQCSFAPKISHYTSNSQISASKPLNKLCQLNSISLQEQFQTNFKASEIDSKIYQKSVEEIPGAQKHIKKHQYCEWEKMRVKRFWSRPFGTLF